MRKVTHALSAKVKQALDDQELSVREAADRCKIGLGLMTNILYGRTERPKPETLEALAAGLNLTYRELALAAYGVITDPVPALATAES